MIQSCPNCGAWLLHVNGSWKHQHTEQAYACHVQLVVEAGSPYVEPEREENVFDYLEGLLA